MLETEIQAKQRKENLFDISLEYGLYPTEAELLALQEFFPTVNLRKIYEIERYHSKLAKILDEQFAQEKEVIEAEIVSLKAQLQDVKNNIDAPGVSGNISKAFSDRHSELKGEIRTLTVQNEAFLRLKELQETKARIDALLKQ